jgi:hypothetical protein
MLSLISAQPDSVAPSKSSASTKAVREIGWQSDKVAGIGPSLSG